MASANASPQNRDVKDQRTGPEPIAGGFVVDPQRPLPGAGGGLPAFTVTDLRYARTDIMAIRIARQAPARAAAVSTLINAAIPGMLCPVGYGPANTPDGGLAPYLVCIAPPGPALWQDLNPDVARAPWSEAELIGRLLRPVAHALDQLADRGLTHRAIRPDNLFHTRQGQPVILGAAWAAPPGLMQPSAFEPPYSAQCHPACRGDGTIADDVYALGVTLLALATGRMPMAGLSDAEIVRRKLERGSFAALLGDERLPSSIHDLVRNMVAEDPDHRPPPLLLTDPLAARARRVAARPPAKASRALEIGGRQIWDARSLAWALAQEPEGGVRLLREQVVDAWLRRSLGQAAMAVRVEEVVRLRAGDPGPDPGRADTMLLLHAVAFLDPLAPLTWRGLNLFPDGVGPAIAWALQPAVDPAPAAAGAPPTGGSRMAQAIETLVSWEAIYSWAEARAERCDVMMLKLDSRQYRTLLRIKGWAGGLTRLRYVLDPLAACASPGLDRACVVRLAGLLPALEAGGEAAVLDSDIASFIAARSLSPMEDDLQIAGRDEDPDIDPPGTTALAGLRVLAGLQAAERAAPVPGLAARLLPALLPALRTWRRGAERERREMALQQAAGVGHLPAMLSVLDDREARAQDRHDAEAAGVQMRRMQARREALAAQIAARSLHARVTGHEVAQALGLTALVAASVAAVLL